MMWKEFLAMALLGMLHHERRKQQIQTVPIERRKRDDRLTVKKARNCLAESVERFGEAIGIDVGDVERKK